MKQILVLLLSGWASFALLSNDMSQNSTRKWICGFFIGFLLYLSEYASYYQAMGSAFEYFSVFVCILAGIVAGSTTSAYPVVSINIIIGASIRVFLSFYITTMNSSISRAADVAAGSIVLLLIIASNLYPKIHSLVLDRFCQSIICGLSSSLLFLSVLYYFSSFIDFPQMIMPCSSVISEILTSTCSNSDSTFAVIVITMIWIGAALISFFHSVSLLDIRAAFLGYKPLDPIAQQTPFLPPLSTNMMRAMSSHEFPDWNVIDTVKPPLNLNYFIDLVGPVMDILTSCIGFQTDNARNQMEHLVILLGNTSLPDDESYWSKSKCLHKKLFFNYVQWCKHLQIDPIMCTDAVLEWSRTAAYSTPRSHGAREKVSEDCFCEIFDLSLWLLIWGEAANIRHMPECLCFLYHKCMEDVLLQCNQGQSGRSLVSGYFVSTVIGPIYDIVAFDNSIKKDHEEKRNYDDFNEFFWSKNCLRFTPFNYSNDDDSCETSINYNGNLMEDTVHVESLRDGLLNAKKSYFERRSWLHPIFSFHRIYIWYLLSFQFLSTIAISRTLVWPMQYFIIILSAMFMTVNACMLLATQLEYWIAVGGCELTTSVTTRGIIFRLMFRLFVLSLQLFMWSKTYLERQESLDDISKTSNELVLQWQSSYWAYIAVSLASLSVDVVDTLLQLFPFALSTIYTSPTLVAQSLLEHLWSLSLLVHTKNVHEKYINVVGYQLFWISLILFKYWYSYVFEIFPTVLPTLQLYDDYMEKAVFDETQSLLLSLLVLARWIPCFMVFCVDMIIFYYIWTFVAGVVKGMERGLGQVRSTKTAQQHLAMAPSMFFNKILSAQATSSIERNEIPIESALEGAQPYQIIHRDSDPIAPHQKQSRRPLVSSRSVADINLLIKLSHSNKVSESSERDALSSQSKASEKWTAFSTAWNEVISSMRDGDILNNYEVDLLLFRKLDWISKPALLPIFQTAGSVEKAVNSLISTSKKLEDELDSAKKLTLLIEFLTTYSDVTMSEAVSELWELFGWLVCQVLGRAHEDDVTNILASIKLCFAGQQMFSHIRAEGLPTLLENIGKFVTILKKSMMKRTALVTQDIENRYLDQISDEKQEIDEMRPAFTLVDKKKMKKSASTPTLTAFTASEPFETSKNLPSATNIRKPKMKKSQLIPDTLRDSLRETLRSVLNSCKSCLMLSSDKSVQDAGQRITFILTLECGFFWDDLYASKHLDSIKGDSRIAVTSSHLFGLSCVGERKVSPISTEAVRRINFFLTSLFMDMPSAVTVSNMPGFSSLTPYYSEEVLMTKSELEAVNSDNVSTLLYLRTLFRRDWENYLERRKLTDESRIWHADHQIATRIWASVRAQTLFRTAEGIIRYEKALTLLATIENSLLNIRQDASMVRERIAQKYNYVITCQVYASMKKNQDSKADEIELLLFRNPGLRVAYIDEIKLRDSPPSFYSVLIKGNAADKTTREVFRIKLPGNPILGEGKPENQNHAVIFTRGHFLQTVDMNQDGYLEEALKIRNLLQEFADSDVDCPTSILGFREHVFTGSVSSLANFMALQETAFVTIGQRVLDEPLHVRFHYGHPDIFDKFFVMSQGGVSKPCKGLHLSEDIFAGYNATLRGSKCRFVEYTQVGKGRDVGMHQIYKFEAKIAQGNAEQSISRDVNRLGRRLDFFRLLSMYFGGVGFYITTSFMLNTLQVLVFTNLLFALFGCEEVGHRVILPESAIQLSLCFMGFLNSLPLFATLAIEKGLVVGLLEIIQVFITGGPLFFLFHLQTRNYYYSQTLLAGGAQYRATGRGFVIRHSKFDEDYRFFAFSHFYLGFDLVVALLLISKYTLVGQYAERMWPFWLIATSFLFAPFWFNPLTFEWDAVADDYSTFMQWMKEKGGSSSNSWIEWYREEVGYYLKLSTSWKACLSFSRCGVYLLISIALIMRGASFSELFHHKKVELATVLVFTFIGLLYLFVVLRISQSTSRSRGWNAFKQFVKGTAIVFAIGGFILLLVLHPTSFQIILGLYYFVASVTIFLMICGFVNEMATIAWLHDMVLAHMLFGVLFLFAAIRLPSIIQTWLLFHNALSSGVVIDDVIQHATKSQSGLTEQEAVIQGLQSRVAEHEEALKNIKSTHSKIVSDRGAFETKTQMSAGKAVDRGIEQYPISAF